MESFTKEVSDPSVLQGWVEIYQEERQKKDKCIEISRWETNRVKEWGRQLYPLREVSE